VNRVRGRKEFMPGIQTAGGHPAVNEL